ncbi:MAG: zinc-binding dehydrogenase [Burkholderiales bacterium]|nr:zinc-binding dehydrogenase [Burkholderiales bacterium]
MKQVLQSLRNGSTEVAEVPCPVVGRGQLLVATSRSLISPGTERMLVEFGRAGWLERAREQPDKVRMVLDKIRADGLAAAMEAVRTKLDQPLAMGYCNVGRAAALGEGVTGFSLGDRVVSNGGHAEFAAVPAESGGQGARCGPGRCRRFRGARGGGALQGIRLAQPTLGEAVVVAGLGVVGLLAVQLLLAHGCRVLGVDPDRSRVALARRFGAEAVDLTAGADPVAEAMRFSRGRGADAVILAAATRSSEPLAQAAAMCRKRGRIVLVGVTGLELSRADFYEKELSFQVSCSYGPGRYDPAYETKGLDYPIGFVRWTAQRNFEAVLDMMAAGRLEVTPLITHRFPIARAPEAYELLASAEAEPRHPARVSGAGSLAPGGAHRGPPRSRADRGPRDRDVSRFGRACKAGACPRVPCCGRNTL